MFSTGLILGLEFPRYVIDQKMKGSCVTGADTQHYRDWVTQAANARRLTATAVNTNTA